MEQGGCLKFHGAHAVLEGIAPTQWLKPR